MSLSSAAVAQAAALPSLGLLPPPALAHRSVVIVAAGGRDLVWPQERIASTSNRNFVGRQGKGVRTHLVSPATAAAAAVTGTFADVRKLLS